MTLIVRYELTTLEQICTAYNSELYQFWECRQRRMQAKVNTGNRFRSCVLGVMSPARFPCAMPVISVLL